MLRRLIPRSCQPFRILVRSGPNRTFGRPAIAVHPYRPYRGACQEVWTGFERRAPSGVRRGKDGKVAVVSQTRQDTDSMTSSPKSLARTRGLYPYILLAAALFIFIKAFPILSPILFSFLLIVLISLALNPLVNRLRSLTGGRKLATGLVVVVMFIVIGVTGFVSWGPIESAFSSLSEKLPVYWESLQKPLIKMEHQAVISEKKLQAEVTTEIKESAKAEGKPEVPAVVAEPGATPPMKEPTAIRSSLVEALQGVLGSVTAVAYNAAQYAVVLVTVFFGVIFTLMNPRPIFASMFSLIPEAHHDQAVTIVRRIGTFVPGWASATLMGMVTIGLLVFLLMWTIFGFSDALVLGMIAGLLEAVPFVGPILSAVPAVLLGLGKGGLSPLWVVLAYCAVQGLENNVILPLIMARGMKLHPVGVMFSMLLNVAAFGVLGVLIAAPMMGIFRILHEELFRKRYLPSVSDADLERLARNALHEKRSVGS